MSVSCEPGSKVTDLRDGISLNAPKPIVVTLLGITMLSSLGTPLKACVSIVVSWLFGAKVIDSRAVYWNAPLPIVVTLLGILIEAKAPGLRLRGIKNAPVPMVTV
jgi:hypothetical protein